MAQDVKLRKAALALFLADEECAVTSYETCTYPGSVFNDKIWRREADDFQAAKAVRDALGLPAFEYLHETNFGGAFAALQSLRKTT